MARGMEEVGASSLEDQFAELESGEDELEVEARLAELKGKALGLGRAGDRLRRGLIPAGRASTGGARGGPVRLARRGRSRPGRPA